MEQQQHQGKHYHSLLVVENDEHTRKMRKNLDLVFIGQEYYTSCTRHIGTYIRMDSLERDGRQHHFSKQVMPFKDGK